MRKWRPPKKSNKRAWKMIDAGDIWWDKKAIERKAKRRSLRSLYYSADRRARSLWRKDCSEGVYGAQIPVKVMYERMYGFSIPHKGANS